jgi:hypothetical protein
MKLKIAFLFLIVSLQQNRMYSQFIYNFLPELFQLTNFTNARTMAMGKANLANADGLNNIISNPAGLTSLNNFEFKADFAGPTAVLKQTKFMNFSTGYNFHKYFQAAVSFFHFDLGKTDFINKDYMPYTNQFSLTLSSQIAKNVSIGANINTIQWRFGIEKKAYYCTYFDFGILKKIDFKDGKFLNLASSLSNFSNANFYHKINNNELNYKLPIALKFGVNYNFKIKTPKNEHKILIVGEYQNYLNSDFFTAYRIGVELEYIKDIYFRVGYYNEHHYDYGISLNKSNINVFTYGLGLKVPFNELINKPYILAIDLTTNRFPKFTKTDDYWGHFFSLNLRFNKLSKKKANEKN